MRGGEHVLESRRLRNALVIDAALRRLKDNFVAAKPRILCRHSMYAPIKGTESSESFDQLLDPPYPVSS